MPSIGQGTVSRRGANSRIAAAPASRVVTVQEMPAYPPELIAGVERAIADAPAEAAFFTYRAIARYFGISRATVARRMAAGLVPGVRLAGRSVVETESKRRFDRNQLYWILLAARMRG